MYYKNMKGFTTRTDLDIGNYTLNTAIYPEQKGSYILTGIPPVNYVTEVPINSFVFAELLDTHFQGVSKKCDDILDRHPEITQFNEDDSC